MKRIVTFMIFAMSLHLFASDVIVQRDSTRIDAKIIEVSDTEIKYKKANNLEGPIFVQKVSEIASVLYENGDVTSYANQGETPKDEKSKTKLKFNPTPSDKYMFGISIGYVSKVLKGDEDYYRSIVGYNYNYNTSLNWLFALKNTATPALRVGLTINPTFKYGLGIRTGVYMEYANDKYDYTVTTTNIDNTKTSTVVHSRSSDITLSLPIQVSYRYEIFKTFSLMLYTGPVFDFGVWREIGSGVMGPGTEGQRSGNWYTQSPYQGFNILWSVAAGIQVWHFRLDVGGEFGIYNKNTGGLYNGKSYWNKPIYATLTFMI